MANRKQIRTTKKIFSVVIISLVLYFLLRIKSYPYTASVFLNNVKPIEVWEYVADFSNMKYLNPTINEFKIIEESGNYSNWRYTTEYKEYLSHWPNLPNYAKAHIIVRTNKSNNKFYITSVHLTCFLNDFLCLNSESEFVFTSQEKGTFCEEIITYECPVIFSLFCKREVAFQRKAIINNLKSTFS